MTRLEKGIEGGRFAVRGGAVLGAVYFGLVFHWVPLALVAADPTPGGVVLALAAFGVIVAGLAGLAALVLGLLHHAVHGLGAPLALALPVTWTALEWTRAHLPDSLALPWLGLGTSLTGFPELVGVAELVGARGVTFWLATVNGLVATLWLAWWGEGRRRRGRGVLAVLTLTVAVLPAAWGLWRARTLETRLAADVAVVQPNVAGRTKVGELDAPLLPAALPPVVGARADDVDLVVLPELVLRGDPRSPEADEALARLRAYARRAGAPVLFGALGEGGGTSQEGGTGAPYNSAYAVDPSGLTDFRYDKRRLVPVVERVPFLSLRAWTGVEDLGVYRGGDGWPLAEVDGTRFGVLICYESSYPESTRELRRRGADVVVNITNDVWLGGPSGWARTVALWQHPAHLVMRAIEARVGAVRSANTGISFVVDPVGRTYGETGLFTRAVEVHAVRTTDVTTLYTRWGDLLGTASAVVASGLLLLAWAGRWSARRASARSLDRSGSHV